MLDDRRTDHLQADDPDELRRPSDRELVVGDELLHERRPTPAELLRPGDVDEPRLVQLALPAAQERDPLVEVLRDGVRGRQVLGQEGAHLVADRDLFRAQGQAHATLIQGEFSPSGEP
ncbi:MAG: hypothetical protein U0S48_20250 [Solirubrobacteraceae bacterium]